MNNYPANTTTAIQLSRLIRHRKSISLPERMSSRMVKCASMLNASEFLGWQMYVPVKGAVEMSLFGTGRLCSSDLEWIAEMTARTTQNSLAKSTGQCTGLTELYEISLPVREITGESVIGFGTSASGTGMIPDTFFKWPVSYSSQFAEIIRVFRDTGAFFRAVLGCAGSEEQALCKRTLLHSWDIQNINPLDYLGHPVRTKFLLLLPSAPSVRLLTVFEEAVPGAKLHYLGSADHTANVDIWDFPLRHSEVLPDYASRILLMEPEIHETIIGVETCEEEMKPIPASHKNTKSKHAVTIGCAMDTAGTRRKITIGEMDLKRHYQITGQTGTGKSTLLATIICSAIQQGYGLTFFDPHGSTIDTVLRSIPKTYAARIRVVRIGNTENPVPLNIWDSDDPQKEERTISDLCELLSDIFDPHREGYVGPRYERWFSTFARASIALLGRRASLESIAVLSQSQDNMFKLYKILADRYPELAEIIKEEYGRDKSSDFQSTLNWYLCKFQRLTSVEQLRKTLGAGTNALDFSHTIDTDTVTLIDLASPVIGTHASRIVGTLLMMKLWNAAMARKERNKTHLAIVDEASLFQTNPMPRMLAESRKFGLSMVLCHQHAGQLAPGIYDALEANSANFSAFRLSSRDAGNAAIRFNDPEMQFSLTRLDAFHAITTLSVDGRQTAPFTLDIRCPKRQKDAEAIAAGIEQSSVENLVEPYRSLRALTPAEILDFLNHPEKTPPFQTDSSDRPSFPPADNVHDLPYWLTDYEKRRAKLKRNHLI